MILIWISILTTFAFCSSNHLQRRCIYTSSQVYRENKGFFSKFVENIRSEFDKNKEIKENIKKFKEEKRKFEQSDALKEARKKFVSSSFGFD